MAQGYKYTIPAESSWTTITLRLTIAQWHMKPKNGLRSVRRTAGDQSMKDSVKRIHGIWSVKSSILDYMVPYGTTFQ